MGHANDDTCWQEDLSTNNFTDYPEIGSDQLRRRHSIPCSLRSSGLTEYSVRTGSTLPGFDNLCDSYYDRDSWLNTLTFDNAPPLNDSEQQPPSLPPELISHLPQQRNQLSSPQLRDVVAPSHEMQDVLPQPTRPRKKSTPTPETLHKFFNTPPPLPAKPQQPLSSRRPQVLPGAQTGSSIQIPQGHPERIIHELPKLPLRRAPSLPNPKSSHMTLPPPIPPKPSQQYLQPILLPKLTHDYLQPKLPPKLDQEYLQPLQIPKPTQENPRPPLPPKQTLENVPPPLPPKSIQPNLHPRLPPKPTQEYQTTIQSPVHVSEPASPTSTTAPSEDETVASIAPLSSPLLTPHPRSSSSSSERSHRRPHFLLRRRCLITASLASFLLSLASISFLVIILVDPFDYSWQTRTFKEGTYKTCVKCLYLMQDMQDGLFNEDIKSLYNEPRDGELYCCAQTSKQMSAMLKLILRQQNYKPTLNNALELGEKPKTVTPSAHTELRYDSPTQARLTPQGHSVMRFNIETKPNEHNRRVNVYKSSLTILVTGWYYVYSNIFYNATSCRLPQAESCKTLEHSIILLSPSQPPRGGSLVKTAHTCCTECNRGDMETSFAGGVFQFNNGDQIFSSVTNIEAVKFDASSNLGLVMLGE